MSSIPSRRLRSMGVVVLPLAVLLAGAADPPEPPVLVIEQAETDGAIHRAGLQAGDRIDAWGVAPAGGPLSSAFDWLWLEMERAPRGTVVLRGERSGQARRFEIGPGRWAARVRPVLSGPTLQDYLEGDRQVAAGALAGGIGLLERAAAGAVDWPVRSWLFLKVGDAWGRTGKWESACRAYERALHEARDAVARALVRDALGVCRERQNEFDGARESYLAALELRGTGDGQRLGVARTLTDLGRLAKNQDRLEEAEDHLRKAIEIERELAPRSLPLADTLNVLGIVAAQRADLAQAEALFNDAASIRADLAADSVILAKTWNNLGVLAFRRGHFEAAESYYQKALRIQELLAPDSAEVARSLHNLGLVARERGDLDLAEEYGRRALAFDKQLFPDTLDVATSMHNLSNVFLDRGQLDEAERLLHEAFDIEQKRAPGGRAAASSLHNLGELLRKRGQDAEAEESFERALALWRKLGTDGVDAAQTLSELAELAFGRGDTLGAKRLQEQAATILERLSPESAALALSLNGLGRIAVREGDRPGAATYFERALATIEAQLGRLGGSPETRAEFRARFERYYEDALALSLSRGRPEEAFHILERSRARSLLAMLAERDLTFTSEIPEELEKARQRIRVEYDQVQEQLASLEDDQDRAKLDALRGELQRVGRERDRVASEIRRRSSRLAALQYPEPLEAAGLQQVIDPGTVVLSFNVGETQTTLFALSRSGLSVHTAPLGEIALRKMVERFRTTIQETRSTSRTHPRWPGLQAMGRQLYDALLRPAESAVAPAARVLILPDGPLHRLPFGALMRATGASSAAGRDWQYFLEWKPLHMAASGSVYAELLRWRHEGQPASRRLVAFGDPQFRTPLPGQRTFGVPDALPFTRREVEAIARLHGAEATVYLGAEATEERAKALGRGQRYVHFATHAVLDDRLPLNSGLAFSRSAGDLGGRENGFLQTWEILESVRLDADLVVLSACDSALGKELRGEGLLGLSRAFHHAGARSVLASLWTVVDDTTPELMRHFYRHLEAGKPKDEALRAAQMALIARPVVTGSGPSRGKDASAPYYWAVFQLMGDWK